MKLRITLAAAAVALPMLLAPPPLARALAEGDVKTARLRWTRARQWLP